MKRSHASSEKSKGHGLDVGPAQVIVILLLYRV